MKKAIRLTIGYADEREARTFAIYENGAGDIDICEIGRPRVEGDRSVCVRIDRGDVILAVEAMEL